MKTTALTCLACLVLGWSAFAQDPSPTSAAPSPAAPAAVASPGQTAAADAAAEAAAEKGDLESRIKDRIKNRLDRRGVRIQVDDDDRRGDPDPDVDFHIDGKDMEDIGALAAIPIVAIIFGSLALFGAPVLIVAAILFFTFLRQRSLHRTVRMMVEKGQPVPPALFAPPPTVRARSDMRKGVVLIMLGLGVIVFFAVVSDGGAWALGMIPLLMGAGYLTVWRLEGNKPGFANTTTNTNPSTDIPPPLP